MCSFVCKCFWFFIGFFSWSVYFKVFGGFLTVRRASRRRISGNMIFYCFGRGKGFFVFLSKCLVKVLMLVCLFWWVCFGVGLGVGGVLFILSFALRVCVIFFFEIFKFFIL